MLLMSYVELNQSRREDVWFLYSGYSNHICGNKQWFSDLDKEFQQSVKLRNNSKIDVLGKGNIRLHIAGVTKIITDVFHIPELRNNLLSVGQLQERGVAILIQHGVCRVYHPNKGLIMQTTMSANRMFIVLAKALPNAPNCFQTTLEDNTQLWHCRYGHLSFKGRSNEEARLDVLEWGDSNEEGSEHDQSEEEAEDEVTVEAGGGEVSLPSSESSRKTSQTSEESSPSSPEGRNKIVPFWMEDYQSKFERDQDSRELSGWRLSEKSESESRSTVVVKLRVRARRARARAQDRRRTRRERSRTRAAVIGGREGRSFSGSR
ncbi:hypothetical protein LWI28_005134 [Acer negundo]|uniref:Retrovirus-related Pol polyprotein from transposon TNT 1-94-like beta-barrel domain-containing protein n=1 Tax=Acer negundo TaxID=4023 RepID=A0AAD5JDC0_ACENE|nr:hypothetical protein LWI28_005134 [Acer negundo]